MKIMFISAANSIHTIRWVNALSEHGNQVTLVSLPNHKSNIDLINNTVQVIFLPFSNAKGYYLNAPYIKNLYKKTNPDIVNVHYASGYGTLARIARLPHIILSVWGSDVYDFPYESRLKHLIVIKNLLYAEKIASTSYAMASQVQKLIGKCKITVTPFGVNTSVFIKNISNHNPDVFTVGIVKTLTPKYGIDTVIKAFAHFYKSIDTENVRLLIYGKGNLKNELVSLCQALNIQDKVTFCGYIPNAKVPDALNQMDVVTLGSIYDSESFGVSAVEAMACELPVIATDVAGFKEVIEDKVTGFIVPRNDYIAMADYLLQLYLDKEMRERMGKAGRKRVQNLYAWNKNVETMLQLFKE